MKRACLAVVLAAGCSAAHADRPCELVLSAKVTPRGRLAYGVQVVIENVSASPVQFVLPERCPAGPIELAGLPDGYDYYSTCNAGPCLGGAGVQTVQLAPRQRRTLASLQLSAAAGSCNPALEPALYAIAPLAPPISNRVCVEPARLDLRNAKIPAAPVVAQLPVSAPPGDDPHACTSSEDCVISCPAVRGCCGWPCGCTNAIHRDRVASFAAVYASSCTRAPNCPIVACAYEPALGAECRNGRCEPLRDRGW
ncbi:MAG TPA: hypothetical protein VJR89_06595 [Polyangiales bacterium]|nr:hypothetical protein [Polyangiales bacterium]